TDPGMTARLDAAYVAIDVGTTNHGLTPFLGRAMSIGTSVFSLVVTTREIPGRKVFC
ncbi:hypothetical protein THAOC_34188, partial [Thalassiosira oceanica]